MGKQTATSPNRHPTSSAYDEKRKKHIRPPGVRSWSQELEQSGLTKHTAQTASDEAKLKQDDLSSRLAPLRTSLKSALVSQRDADRAVRSQKNAGKRVKKKLYATLQQTRETVRTTRRSMAPLETQLREQKQLRYFYNKLSKATASTATPQPSDEPQPTIPTTLHPGFQDFVEAVSLDSLLDGIQDKDKQLPISGTDRGLVVMSETVPSTWSSMEAMVNRYHVLHALPDSQTTNDESTGQESNVNTDSIDMELDLDKNSYVSSVTTSGLTARSGSTVPFASTATFESTALFGSTDSLGPTAPSGSFIPSGLMTSSALSDPTTGLPPMATLPASHTTSNTFSQSPTRKSAAADMRFSTPNRITSQQIHEVGGGRKAARLRERLLRKPENEVVSALHKTIGDHSVLQAQTIQEVDDAQGFRNAAAGTLRKFESNKQLLRESHRRDLQTKRAWQTLAAQERRLVCNNAQQQVKMLPTVTPTMPTTSSQEFSLIQNVSLIHSPSLPQLSAASTPMPIGISAPASVLSSQSNRNQESAWSLPEQASAAPISATAASFGESSSSTISAPAGPSEADPSAGSYSLAPVPIRNTVDPSDGYCSCGRHHIPFRIDGTLVYPEICPQDALQSIPLMFVGTQGVGNGSRIGGHLKFGGRRVVEQHFQTVPVLMTGEHMTSKTCPFCFRLVRLVKELRLVNGSPKLVTINGAIQCDNPDCTSFQAGYCRRGRDSNACINIAIAGFSQLTSENRQTLPPYRRLLRPSDATPSPPQSIVTGYNSSLSHQPAVGCKHSQVSDAGDDQFS